MLPYLLAMSVPAAVIALLVARWEYRRHGKLTAIGVLLLCTMLIIPNLVLEFATRYEMPTSLLDYAGVIVALLGITLCALGMVAFKSVAKIFCLDTGELAVSGVFRYSRNPQYVGYLLFLTGFALTDWSPWCLAALTVVAVSLHLLVLIEEEHLGRVFGQAFVDYCRRVPRYFPVTSSFLGDVRGKSDGFPRR